jgi:hypothetical protein
MDKAAKCKSLSAGWKRDSSPRQHKMIQGLLTVKHKPYQLCVEIHSKDFNQKERDSSPRQHKMIQGLLIVKHKPYQLCVEIHSKDFNLKTDVTFQFSLKVV